jgi:hypothetical protein
VPIPASTPPVQLSPSSLAMPPLSLQRKKNIEDVGVGSFNIFKTANLSPQQLLQIQLNNSNQSLPYHDKDPI